jgi:hypothetical protein
MSALLFSVGILVGLIGLFTIGFGIPIHDFGLGNTLIVSGALASVGGLLLIGIASVVREIRKLAKVMAVQPVRAEGPASVIQQPAPAGQRAIAGPKLATSPKQPAQRGPRAEPRIEPAPDLPPPLPPEVPTERPRPSIFSINRPPATVEPPVVDESEDAPLSPSPSVISRQPGRNGDHPPIEPKFAPEPKAVPEPANRLSEPIIPPAPPAQPAPPRMPRFELPAPAAPERVPERQPQEAQPARPSRNLFDTVWPTEPKAKPERQPAFAPEPPVREEAPPPPSPKPVSILKSGVIDGMAYTLYTDGSIEAQLQQGVVRFASIDELRVHLEENA